MAVKVILEAREMRCVSNAPMETPNIKYKPSYTIDSRKANGNQKRYDARKEDEMLILMSKNGKEPKREIVVLKRGYIQEYGKYVCPISPHVSSFSSCATVVTLSVDDPEDMSRNPSPLTSVIGYKSVFVGVHQFKKFSSIK